MQRARIAAAAAAFVIVGAAALGADGGLQAQPARGAAAAFQEVLKKFNDSFRQMQLAGDPDKDYAAMLLAHHEDLVFLAKTHLEYGGDRRLRDLSQRILDDTQQQISLLKEWQVRNREPRYQAQPNQPPPGTGPLDTGQQAAPTQHPAGHGGTAAAPAAPPGPQAAVSGQPAQGSRPLVAGTVKKVDAGAGKITIDHGPIPNLNMDGMTMVFRVQDPAILKQTKAGEKIQFEADRVNGQLTITRVVRGR